MHEYCRPAIVDYGSLVELTEAIGVNGAEDGASKLIPFHHSAPIGI
jgi:hypothetical protein